MTLVRKRYNSYNILKQRVGCKVKCLWEAESMIKVGNKSIGKGVPTFIVAELSGNHKQDFNRACQLIEVAAECGADAVKLQTYTSDTITLNSNKEYFQTQENGLWAGQTLYEL